MRSHLQDLEAEAIHIFREAYVQAVNPVLLYSIGKDSSVLLHLARKAFAPAQLPFPLLHINTLWKFKEMYTFRERIIKRAKRSSVLAYWIKRSWKVNDSE